MVAPATRSSVWAAEFSWREGRAARLRFAPIMVGGRNYAGDAGAMFPVVSESVAYAVRFGRACRAPAEGTGPDAGSYPGGACRKIFFD